MKKIITILFILLNIIVYSQLDNTEVYTLNNDISDIQKARTQIIKLKEEGALVVRIHLSKKNIALYRNAGKTKLADKLQEKLDRDNFFTTLAFLDTTFSFCPVYVIDAKNYSRVLNGEKSGYFLNKDLNVDSSIVMKEKYFFFIDRGNIYDQVSKNYKTSETSSTPVLQDVFVIKDSNLEQLVKPFPYYRRILGYTKLHTNLGYFSVSENRWISKIDVSKIRKRTNMSKEEIIKDSKNITEYYKRLYGLKNNELVLPYNIYQLNVKLINYYKKIKFKTSNQ